MLFLLRFSLEALLVMGLWLWWGACLVIDHLRGLPRGAWLLVWGVVGVLVAIWIGCEASSAGMLICGGGDYLRLRRRYIDPQTGLRITAVISKGNRKLGGCVLGFYVTDPQYGRESGDMYGGCPGTCRYNPSNRAYSPKSPCYNTKYHGKQSMYSHLASVERSPDVELVIKWGALTGVRYGVHGDPGLVWPVLAPIHAEVVRRKMTTLGYTAAWRDRSPLPLMASVQCAADAIEASLDGWDVYATGGADLLAALRRLRPIIGPIYSCPALPGVRTCTGSAETKACPISCSGEGGRHVFNRTH